jgi:hypothetical protein
MTRVRFVGNALFIPFFLLSVGMLVDPRVLAGSGRVWMLAGSRSRCWCTSGSSPALDLAAHLRLLPRTRGWSIFGLSLPQAAATLAVTFVGLEIGLFDEDVVNAVVVMILVTGLVGPSLVERFGQARRARGGGEAVRPGRGAAADPRADGEPGDLGRPDGPRADHPRAGLARADPPAHRGPAEADQAPTSTSRSRRRCSATPSPYAAAADVPVVPITRMDHNFASGIARGGRRDALLDGDHRVGRARAPRRGIFGSVLDQLLELTKQQVLVAKLGHPLNTTQRIVLLVPPAGQRPPCRASSRPSAR